MKNIITFLFITFAMCVIVPAQNSFPEFEIAREIKLLKSTRSDVNALMSEFDSAKINDDDEYFYQNFYSDNGKVRVYYSEGECSKLEDEDDELPDYPEWNVPKMLAMKVVITFKEDPKLQDLGLDLAGFKKKLKEDDDEDSEDYIYYDENAGIIILTEEGEVGKIILHPPKKQSGSLCKNEKTSQFLSSAKSFVDSIIRSEPNSGFINLPSFVKNLDLQPNGVFGCKDEQCLDAKKEISVTTAAVDRENDMLVYDYTVSGGKIVGSGWNVVWDLANVAPGIYSITAGTDDGCGICGETQTQRILVKENSYELISPVKMKELILDKTELVAACPVGRLRRVFCPTGSCGVSIASVAAEDKNAAYRYKANYGKIVGSGDKVIWDLSNLKTGEYQIEVSASTDGIGFGEPKTATVVIKENPSCTAPKKISEEK